MVRLKEYQYHACQIVVIAREFELICRERTNNKFFWSEAVINFSGEPNYQPHWPWVSKFRDDEIISLDTFVYVDGGRNT